MSAHHGGGGRGATGTLHLTLAAVGVVYGDIGTSPLYAIRECFHGSHSVPPTEANVLGVLSLIVYSLLMVVSVKYIAVVLRADNQGEGGILALTALLPRRTEENRGGRSIAQPARPVLVGIGIFGAALLYGDGMITPAITVLGATEGLEVATPLFAPFVVPISVAILVGVFAVQRFGTHRIGRLYGPIMVLWFVALAVLGLRGIVTAPIVLYAFDPRYGVSFFVENGWYGFAVLGAVVLVTTGAEALYSDLGHFGRRPIRLAWFMLVLPSLLLNYFGQGALLVLTPDSTQPFFQLAPSWALYPLVGLSTLAAIIASQALISGAFSLTRGAVQLGYAPRVDVEHTSSSERGQVYVPQVNWFLAASTILIVLGFQSSGALAAAYGIAVTLTMVCTALLLRVVALERWKWPPMLVLGLTVVFLSIDFAFLGANLLKVQQGGWLPLVIGAAIFTLMTTWKTGRTLLSERLSARAVPLEDFLRQALASGPARVPGTAVYMTAHPRGTPPALAHNVRYNKVLHRTVVVLTVRTIQAPYVDERHRLSVSALGEGFFDVWVQCGFMEDPDVPQALAQARANGAPIDEDDIAYFLGRETIIPTHESGMAPWRERLFVLMARNAVRPTAYFRLPADHVIELGVQVEM
jgi:KUP system potassium uptake protein